MARVPTEVSSVVALADAEQDEFTFGQADEDFALRPAGSAVRPWRLTSPFPRRVE